MQKLPILNASVDNITAEELLVRLTEGVLVTPNVDHLVRLQRDYEFYKCYQNADFIVCDSRIVYLLTKLLNPGHGLRAQITGSDFFPRFCNHHASAASDVRIFLLGGTASSVLTAQANINKRTNKPIVVGCYSPPFGFEHSATETEKIYAAIRACNANVLAVGVGSPKQEKWIDQHRAALPEVRIFMGIGATIEFESGNLKRAPKWMTNCGLEWLFRLSQEPKRLMRRYLIEDLPFFYLYFKQRLGLYKNPWKQ